MKNTFLVSAMLLAGVALASPKITTSVEIPISKQLHDKKVKIEADALPQPVKVTITDDDSINRFPISEAWQVTQEDGSFHYLVKFENKTEADLSKQYDNDGVEINA